MKPETLEALVNEGFRLEQIVLATAVYTIINSKKVKNRHLENKGLFEKEVKEKFRDIFNDFANTDLDIVYALGTSIANYEGIAEMDSVKTTFRSLIGL